MDVELKTHHGFMNYVSKKRKNILKIFFVASVIIKQILILFIEE